MSCLREPAPRHAAALQHVRHDHRGRVQRRPFRPPGPRPDAAARRLPAVARQPARARARAGRVLSHDRGRVEGLLRALGLGDGAPLPPTPTNSGAPRAPASTRSPGATSSSDWPATRSAPMRPRPSCAVRRSKTPDPTKTRRSRRAARWPTRSSSTHPPRSLIALAPTAGSA